MNHAVILLYFYEKKKLEILGKNLDMVSVFTSGRNWKAR